MFENCCVEIWPCLDLNEFGQITGENSNREAIKSRVNYNKNIEVQFDNVIISPQMCDCVFICMSVYVSVHLSVCVFVHLSICLSACLSF